MLVINILNMSGRYAYIVFGLNIGTISDENLGCLSVIMVSSLKEGSPSILKYMDEIHY